MRNWWHLTRMKKGWIWNGEGRQKRKRWYFFPCLIRGLSEYHNPPTLCGGTGSSWHSERGYPASVFHSTCLLPNAAVPFPFLIPKSADAVTIDKCGQEVKWNTYIYAKSPHPNCYTSVCILKTTILILILFLTSETILNQTQGKFSN